jgi:hypothetical protein
MSKNLAASIQAHFGDVEDPRRQYPNDHPLINILTAPCAPSLSERKAGLIVRTLVARRNPD